MQCSNNIRISSQISGYKNATLDMTFCREKLKNKGKDAILLVAQIWITTLVGSWYGKNYTNQTSEGIADNRSNL